MTGSCDPVKAAMTAFCASELTLEVAWLWMALSAALPVWWSPLWVYFGITLILGLLDWTGLARAVRSKLLALREEDFCTAAMLMGAKPRRIIGRQSPW